MTSTVTPTSAKIAIAKLLSPKIARTTNKSLVATASVVLILMVKIVRLPSRMRYGISSRRSFKIAIEAASIAVSEPARAHCNPDAR